MIQTNYPNLLNTDLSIKSKGQKARINNEISCLFDQCEYVSSERKENAISLKIIKAGNMYDFDLPKDYPFKMPINICYNGNDYKRSLYTSSKKIQLYLKNFYGIKCLCCSTILCSEWTPAYYICKIINEIHNMSMIKKEIKIRLICDEVRNKYKCYFAELERYLF